MLEAESRRERLSLKNCGPNLTLASQDSSICTKCEHGKPRLSGSNLHTKTHAYLYEAFFYVHKLLTSEPKQISTNIKRFSHAEYVYSIKYFYSYSSNALTNNATLNTLLNSLFIHEFARVHL